MQRLEHVDEETAHEPKTRRPVTLSGCGVLALSFVCIAFLLLVLALAFLSSRPKETSFPNEAPASPATGSAVSAPPPVSKEMFSECLRDFNRPQYDFLHPELKAVPDDRFILVVNQCWGHGTGRCAIAVEGGKIKDIGSSETVFKPGWKVLGYGYGFATPGLVDAHSHLGVYSYPDNFWATNDGNDITGPTTPQMRVVDALDPLDPAIDLIREGGITTSQVLPGSANDMGGEGLQIKHTRQPTDGDVRTVEDMIIPEGNRILKMACGENPKRVYSMSRMGSAWKLRQKFEQAQRLRNAQDAWCNSSTFKSWESAPRDLSLQPLVNLLRGDALLQMHCYRVADMDMALRVANEFDYKVTTFHHAHEAHLIPEKLKKSGVSLAIFADIWGYKYEAYRASVHAASKLMAAGINVAFKSDHPVTYARALLEQAAMAHHYGLGADDAIASVTINAAKAIGLDDRLGSLEVGKDADIVVWDRHPLRLGAKAVAVFVNGKTDDKALLKIQEMEEEENNHIVPSNDLNFTCPSNTSKPLVIRGATVRADPSHGSLYPGVVVVENGIITCVARTCSTPADAEIIDLTGESYNIVPGFIESDSWVGQSEVDAESSTQDGFVSATLQQALTIRASDGIRLGRPEMNKHAYAAWAGGVTTVVAHPMGSSQFLGWSTAFHPHGTVLNTNTLVSDAERKQTSQGRQFTEGGPGFVVTIGEDAKSSGMSQSISGQMSGLWDAMLSVGLSTLIVRCNQADTIAAVLRTKKEFEQLHSHTVRMVILGGAEAHLVADMLGAAGASVVLSPAREFGPIDWNRRRTSNDSYRILTAAGVKVGIAVGRASDGNTRHLRWEIPFLSVEGADPDRVENQLWAAITSNVADIFNLGPGIGRIEVGTRANFVVLSSESVTGSSLELTSRIEMIVAAGTVDCRPTQK